jgi:hypothetical protein
VNQDKREAQIAAEEIETQLGKGILTKFKTNASKYRQKI